MKCAALNLKSGFASFNVNVAWVVKSERRSAVAAIAVDVVATAPPLDGGSVSLAPTPAPTPTPPSCEAGATPADPGTAGLLPPVPLLVVSLSATTSERVAVAATGPTCGTASRVAPARDAASCALPLLDDFAAAEWRLDEPADLMRPGVRGWRIALHSRYMKGRASSTNSAVQRRGDDQLTSPTHHPHHPNKASNTKLTDRQAHLGWLAVSHPLAEREGTRRFVLLGCENPAPESMSHLDSKQQASGEGGVDLVMRTKTSKQQQTTTNNKMLCLSYFITDVGRFPFAWQHTGVRFPFWLLWKRNHLATSSCRADTCPPPTRDWFATSSPAVTSEALVQSTAA